jgi:hypothetical protein
MTQIIDVLENIINGVETCEPEKIAPDCQIETNQPEFSYGETTEIRADFCIPSNFFASTQIDNPLEKFLFEEKTKISVIIFTLLIYIHVY